VRVVMAARLQTGAGAPGSGVSTLGGGLTGALGVFDGHPATPVMAQDTQINTQVPLSATGAMEVVVGSTVLLNTTLTIVGSAPGIFTGPGGTGPAVMGNQDGSVNSNASPAPQGSIVAFYATGIGQGAVGVTIGGSAANVVFAGDAPGFVGVSQINAQVPVGIASGTVSLLMTASGTPSQTGVTMFVQ
jgi:uncharacterized protein (TIGR03437 family)